MSIKNLDFVKLLCGDHPVYKQTNTNKQVWPNCGRENSERHMLECLSSIGTDIIDTCLNFGDTPENRKEAAQKLNEWFKQDRKLGEYRSNVRLTL